MSLERVFVCMAKLEKLTMSKSKVKLMKLERTLKVMTQKTSTIRMKQAYTSSSFLIPLIQHEMKKEVKFKEQGTESERSSHTHYLH